MIANASSDLQLKKGDEYYESENKSAKKYKIMLWKTVRGILEWIRSSWKELLSLITKIWLRHGHTMPLNACPESNQSLYFLELFKNTHIKLKKFVQDFRLTWVMSLLMVLLDNTSTYLQRAFCIAVIKF